MFKTLCTILIWLSVIYSSHAQTTFTVYTGNDNNNATFLGDLNTLGYEFFSKKDVEGGFTGDEFTLGFSNNKSGTWSTGGIQIAGMVIKASNQFLFVDFGLGNTQTSGNWCTDGSCTIDGLAPIVLLKNGNSPDLSHLSLYTAVSPVPEASTIVLMLSGLGVFGFMMRRKNSN